MKKGLAVLQGLFFFKSPLLSHMHVLALPKQNKLKQPILLMTIKKIALILGACSLINLTPMMQRKNPRLEETDRPRRLEFADFKDLTKSLPSTPRTIGRKVLIEDGVSEFEVLVALKISHTPQPLQHPRMLDLDDRIMSYKRNGKSVVYCKCNGCGTYMHKGTCGYTPVF